MRYTARLPEKNVNVTPTSPLGDFFTLAGGLTAIVVALYLVLGLVVDLIVPRVSPEVENRMGSFFVRPFATARDESDAAMAVQALLDDLQKRCAELPYQFKALVYDSETANAMALPGGNIVVFTGLLEKMSTENELAFVLAHELGHYANRDHLRGVGRALVFMVVSTVLFGPDSSVGNLLGNALSITELSFSRKQETQADEFAMDTQNCAYGHVGGATDFFQTMDKAQDPGIFGHYFSSHPENQRRIAHLQSYAHTKGYVWGSTRPLPEVFRELEINDNPR